MDEVAGLCQLRCRERLAEGRAFGGEGSDGVARRALAEVLAERVGDGVERARRAFGRGGTRG